MKGHVRKRGNKWCFVVDLGKDPETGKRQQKWFSGFKTKRDAEKALVEKLNELNRGEYVEPSKMSFETLIRSWIEDRVRHSVSQKTYDTYKYLSEKHVIPGIGRIPLNNLNPIHLQKFYSDLLGKGLSPTSVRRIHQVCRSSLKWAQQIKLIPKNPAESVSPPKKSSPEMKIWSVEEVEKFLECARGERFYTLFLLALHTGLRQGELLGLRWSDINFEQGVVYVRRAVQRNSKGLVIKEEPKTSKSRRSVYVSPSVVEELKRHRRRVKEEMMKIGRTDVDLVFPNQLGNIQEPRKVIQHFHRLIERAGVPKIRFHDLRHTHASLLLQQGVHPKIVSERLGHSNISITLDIYSHSVPSLQKQASEVFDSLLKKGRKSI